VDDQLIETWNNHNQINLYVLDALTPEALGSNPAQAIETLLRLGLAAGGKIKGIRPHATFLGYMIAHESYHRGEIGMVLAQSGHPLDNKIAYGMWE
jgi:uncharacterized damage-inducible protein DinB